MTVEKNQVCQYGMLYFVDVIRRLLYYIEYEIVNVMENLIIGRGVTRQAERTCTTHLYTYERI